MCIRDRYFSGYCYDHIEHNDFHKKKKKPKPVGLKKENTEGTRICEFPDCGKKHNAKGLCLTHYQRWLGRGCPEDRSELDELKYKRGDGVNHSKMTKEKVLELRRLRGLKKHTIPELARMFGICQSAAGSIIRRKSWKHV